MDCSFLLRESALSNSANTRIPEAMPLLPARQSGFLKSYEDRRFESQGEDMKKAAIYARVSTPDQHLETQLYDLRKLAAQRGFEVVREYCDRGISGSKTKRP